MYQVWAVAGCHAWDVFRLEEENDDDDDDEEEEIDKAERYDGRGGRHTSIRQRTKRIKRRRAVKNSIPFCWVFGVLIHKRRKSILSKHVFRWALFHGLRNRPLPVLGREIDRERVSSLLGIAFIPCQSLQLVHRMYNICFLSVCS